MDVYNAFTASVLANDDQWKTMLKEDVYLKGPLAEVQGKDDFITLNTPYFDSIQTMETHQLIEQGNRIVTQITTTIQTPGGKKISFDVSEWYHIEDGQLQDLRVFFDPRALL